jgi:hypothetical protein
MACSGTYNIIGSFAHLGKTSNCGCGCGTDGCSCDPIQSDAVIYSGPNLPCTGVQTCDTLTNALMKMDSRICELITDLYNLTSTTTTSTTLPI